MKFFMVLLLFIAFSATSSVSAFAKSGAKPYKPEIWEFSSAVIRSSLKCEVGRVAKSIGKSLPAYVSRAQITVKLENSREDLKKLKFKLPFWETQGEASNEQTVTAGEEIKVVYNISKANADANCAKNNKFRIGVYECLRDKLAIWSDQGVEASGSFSCTSSVNVKRVVSGSLGTKVWIIDVGPSGSSTEKAVYTFKVDVPPQK